MHILLFYDIVEGYIEKRKPFRADELVANIEALITRTTPAAAG